MEKLNIFDITCCLDFIREILNKKGSNEYIENIKTLSKNKEIDAILIIHSRKPNNAKVIGLRKDIKNNKDLLFGLGRPIILEINQFPPLIVPSKKEYKMNSDQYSGFIDLYDIYFNNKDSNLNFFKYGGLDYSLTEYVKKYIIEK